MPSAVVLVLWTRLLRPDDGAGDRRQVAHAAHAARLAVRILHLELLVQRLDVVLHALDQLRLVLADRAADVRPDEERVEAREDAEHLVGVARRAELVAQAGGDARLHAVNTLVITTHTEGYQ